MTAVLADSRGLELLTRGLVGWLRPLATDVPQRDQPVRGRRLWRGVRSSWAKRRPPVKATRLTPPQRPGDRLADAVQFATLEWVDWFSHRRLLEPLGYVPPAEFEARYYQQAGVA